MDNSIKVIPLTYTNIKVCSYFSGKLLNAVCRSFTRLRIECILTLPPFSL